MSGPAKARPPRASDPYGVGPVGSWIAPVLAIVGLLLIAVVTLNLLQGEMPFGIGGGGTGNGNGNGNGTGNGDDPQRTAAPSNIVVVPEEATFEGSIVYAKAGNIWIQTDDQVRQLTQGGDDAMPTWSPDGQYVYYIHTVADEGKWPARGVVESYALDVPQLMRTRADGTGKPERLATSRFKKGNLTYAYWIRQPAIAPDGSKIAVVSDAPNPDQSTVVLQFWNPGDEEVQQGRCRRERRPRSSGPRVAPRRQVPPVRPQRPATAPAERRRSCATTSRRARSRR